jgi:hypothetical protein
MLHSARIVRGAKVVLSRYSTLNIDLDPELPMRRLALTAGFSSLVLLTAAAPGTAQSPRDSVVAVVNEFFRAMTAHDSATLARVQFPDGVHFSARVQGDSVAINHGTTQDFARRIGEMKDTYVERMWEPTVLVHGPLAVVWAPYDIHRNREFVHCGVDAFTLVRSPAGWRIATVSYTAEPTGCKPSPLGPLPK